MTQVSAFEVPSSAYGSFQPVLDLQTAIIQSLLQAQQIQLQMLTAWQQPFTAVNKELWDQWICRFGGGVPLDG